MLELMKELGFIPESKAIKLAMRNGKVVGERYDRVTYLREVLPISAEGLEEEVYVESGRFLSLLPFIRNVQRTNTYLLVVLVNGARYELPYLDLEFSAPQIPEEPRICIQGAIDFTVLKKTALQNLVKPEMRCIYVDDKGAVTCNFLQGTVDTAIVTEEPILLPPDLTTYMTPSQDAIIFTSGNIICFTDKEKVWVYSPKADFEESEDPWYRTIYETAMAVKDEPFSPLPQYIDESLKRLANFGNEVVITGDRMTTGENYEPISCPSALGGEFTIEDVLSVIQNGKDIFFTESAMFLRNGSTTIMVSTKEN